jgi:hypothetical protein
MERAMNSEIVIFTTLVALLGAGWLLVPRSSASARQRQSAQRQRQNALKQRQNALKQRQQAEFDAFVRPYLLFSTSAPVAHC